MAAARRTGSVTRRKRFGKKGYYPGWWCRYRKPGPDGGRTWAHGGATPEEAEAKLARLLAGEPAGAASAATKPSKGPGDQRTLSEAAQPSPAAPEPQAPPRSDLLFSEFLADIYLPKLKVEMEPGWYATVHRFLFDAAGGLGAKPMCEVTEDDIEGLLDRRRERGNGPATIRKFAYQVGVAFAVAKRKKVIAVNPIRWTRKRSEEGIVLPKIKEKAVLPYGYIFPSELQIVLAAVQPASYRPTLAFLRETGLRPSEAGRLTPYSVETGEKAVNIDESKTGETRRVPLTNRAKTIIRTILAERKVRPMTGPNLLFPYIDRHNLRKALNAACKKVRKHAMRLYDLRHLYGTGLVRAGVPIPDVAKLMGNSPSQVLERYGKHLPKNYAEQAIRTLEEHEAKEAKEVTETKEVAGTLQAQSA